MRPVWTFSEFSLQSYSRFRERSFFRRCGKGEQMRCLLILLISEHPTQQGIRKGGVRHFGHGRTDEDGRTEWRILSSWICQSQLKYLLFVKVDQNIQYLPKLSNIFTICQSQLKYLLFVKVDQNNCKYWNKVDQIFRSCQSWQKYLLFVKVD